MKYVKQVLIFAVLLMIPTAALAQTKVESAPYVAWHLVERAVERARAEEAAGTAALVEMLHDAVAVHVAAVEHQKHGENGGPQRQ